MTDGIAHGLLPWFTKFNGVVPDTRWVGRSPRASTCMPSSSRCSPRRRRLPRSPSSIPATTLRHYARETRAEAEAQRPRLLSRADRGAAAVRDALGPGDDAGVARPLQGGDPRQRRPACRTRSARRSRPTSRAAAASSRRTRPRPATRTASRATPSLSAKLLGVTMTAPARGPVKNTYVAINGNHPISAGYDGAARIIGGTHLIAVDAAVRRRRAVPLRPRLSRPPHGGGLSARGAARRRRRRPRACRAAAARSTSPGTSARPSGKCWPPTTAG